MDCPLKRFTDGEVAYFNGPSNKNENEDYNKCSHDVERKKEKLKENRTEMFQLPGHPQSA